MKPTDDKIKYILTEAFKESNRLGSNKITPDYMTLVILNDKKNESETPGVQNTPIEDGQ